MPTEILLIFTGYALGCVSAGYYLVRLRAGEDIRGLGSGSAGATNVGRKLGAWGFSATLLLDAGKGAAAAGAAAHLGVEPAGAMWTIVAVAAGHIWPLQLRFRGGKGVAPALGGILIFDYRLGIIAVLLCGIIFLFTRRFTLSGLVAAIFLPGIAWSLGYPGQILLAISALVALIVFSHRHNIRALVLEFARDTRPEEAP
ncbi:MAG TPA: glycerol-3-phosphate acyltransferase [Candidatus Binatia bacterium]|jgi:glycerol-3-phosphate acyltransferase PlsY